MLKGRLGLAGGGMPHADRLGLLWLGRGRLYVEDGTLRFRTRGTEELPAGDYAIPYQTLSCLILGPGASVSHDAFRILARHGVGVSIVGTAGVRHYASLPKGPDSSRRARNQALAWADADVRVFVARRMYAWRLGEVLGATKIEVLRGMEGARMRRTYQLVAERYGVRWKGRRYNRSDPDGDDVPNRAINHASAAVRGAAGVAVAATGTIPQLGFIHEDSGESFTLDIADLFRDDVTLPIAFAAAARHEEGSTWTLERRVRDVAAREFRRLKVIPRMIDRIKELFDADDGDRDTERS